MFKWWNNLFGAGYERLVEKQVEMDEYEDEIKQEIVLEVKDVSEPVVSFVECVKGNPKRFKLKLTYDGNSIYELTDTVTKQSWRLRESSLSFSLKYSSKDPARNYYGWPPFLTEDEKEHFLEHLKPHFEERSSRYVKIREERNQRASNKERQRLMTVYCKGE